MKIRKFFVTSKKYFIIPKTTIHNYIQGNNMMSYDDVEGIKSDLPKDKKDNFYSFYE